MESEHRVAHYYDSNTLRFLLFGRGGRSYAIHRELWGPGVTNAEDASGYVNRLLAERISELGGAEPLTLLDLGCGVGGTLFHLGGHFPRALLHGVTISPRQHRIATWLAGRRGLDGRCHIWLGDFERLRLDLRADVALAVESFVHGSAPGHFFRSAAEHLRPGGHLIVVDDFLAREAETLSAAERRHVSDFREGWRVPSLCTTRSCVEAAEASGLALVHDTDLSGLVRPGRPRDRVIARLSPVFQRLKLGRFPFYANMIGGNALQTGHREGFLHYRMLVLRRGTTHGNADADSGAQTAAAHPARP